MLFSPSHEQLPARELADWILADRLPVRFQMQLHKVLWGNVPGQVDAVMSDRAVVLLSGGLDSATVLAMARAQGFECYALSVDYGQRTRPSSTPRRASPQRSARASIASCAWISPASAARR